MSQEITTKTDQYGNVERGYYREIPVTVKGEPTGETTKIWVPERHEPSALKTLGNDYETNGPTGAPKILALLHIVDKDSNIVQAGSANSNSLVLSFYRLTKSSNNVDKLKQREYEDPREPVSTVVRTVTRWKYIQLFNGMYEDEIISQTVNNGEGVTVLEFGPEETVFKAEDFFINNLKVLDKSVGPAVALISFDEDESERQRVTDVEVLKSQFAQNKDGISWIVPAKLSNPECIYVDKKYIGKCSLFDYLSYEDEQKIITEMKEILTKYQNKKKEVDMLNKTLNAEILELNSKHDAKFQEINSKKLYFLNQTRKTKQIEDYKSTPEYKSETTQIQEKEAQQRNNKEELETLAIQYNSLYSRIRNLKIKNPIVYYGLLFRINRDFRFFIEPDFSEGSLANLVYKKCISSSSSGGKRRNNNCYLKFRKTKRKNAKPLRKNTKKYYRRSNRK
jgi:hypothetical protein